jgi:hypothetical protein
LDCEILKIGRILSVRWVASSRRTVNAVLKNYPALCEHFNRASTDMSRDARERSKYDGLKKMITSVEFVANLNAMSDALDELGDLCEFLQRRNITLIDADKAVRTTIRVLDSMANEPGPKLSEVQNALNVKEFKGVPLHDGKVKIINTAQFFRSLANNLRNRMMTSSSSHVSSNAGNDNSIKQYNFLLRNLEVLNPKNWPKSDDDEVDITYGDKEVRQLCDQFILEKQVQGII